MIFLLRTTKTLVDEETHTLPADSDNNDVVDLHDSFSGYVILQKVGLKKTFNEYAERFDFHHIFRKCPRRNS